MEVVVRVFRRNEILEAYAYAEAGGQALHLHRTIPDRGIAPRCFVAAVDRGRDIAHLFDRDRSRLVATARRLGVRVVCVDAGGTPRQHVDLCGSPLRKALAECEVASWGEYCPDCNAEYERARIEDGLDGDDL
jgi:hypothetical protein